MTQPFRFQPQMPVTCYQTFRIAIPLMTHWRQATCEEVDCEQWRIGWTTQVDENQELGQRRAYYIRHDRSRRHVEEKTPEGLASFWFPPGQNCFQTGNHKVQNGRPEFYIKRHGDHRGNPTGYSQQLKVQSWLDDFGEHQETLQEAQEKG